MAVQQTTYWKISIQPIPHVIIACGVSTAWGPTLHLAHIAPTRATPMVTGIWELGDVILPPPPTARIPPARMFITWGDVTINNPPVTWVIKKFPPAAGIFFPAG